MGQESHDPYLSKSTENEGMIDNYISNHNVDCGVCHTEEDWDYVGAQISTHTMSLESQERLCRGG